jgi:excisionase family DNA binding protein
METKLASSQLLTREQFAQRIAVSLRKADELILTKQIASLKIGRRRLVSELALAAFIRKQEAAAR